MRILSANNNNNKQNRPRKNDFDKYWLTYNFQNIQNLENSYDVQQNFDDS